MVTSTGKSMPLLKISTVVDSDLPTSTMTVIEDGATRMSSGSRHEGTPGVM